MRSERDATRIVRSWLEAGSIAVPERVLDAVLSELPSTPQRRHWWSPWRSRRMNTVMRIAAVTAAGLVPVVVGSRFLPGGSNVGGPSAVSISGQVTFLLGGVDEFTVGVDASAIGSSLSGSAAVSYDGGDVRIRFGCARLFDATTWMLAGEIEGATPGTVDVGTRTALIVREGSPQQVGLWFEDAPPAADCDAFVSAIPADAVEDPASLSPVTDGRISLPASLDG